MKVIFRVDASEIIGSGHVMRCLTLAEGLQDRGVSVEFITRKHPRNLNKQIESKGFKVNLLPIITTNQPQQGLSEYGKWLNVKQEVDAYETIQVLTEKQIDWLIIDHYGLDYSWEDVLRPYTIKIMVIDDLANRNHNCDLLLDQNYINDQGRYNQLLPLDTIKLLGPKYALLRKEFIKNRKECAHYSIKRVFVFFGGSDSANLTSVSIKALSHPKLAHLLVDVVIGSINSNWLTLKTEIESRPNAKLHLQIDNIAELMAKADISLGAGGTTTWERMSLGLPSIVITVAKNQISFTSNLDKYKYIKWLGNANQIDEYVIYNALLESIKNPFRLQEQAKKCRDLVDGMGTNRVVNLLMKCN